MRSRLIALLFIVSLPVCLAAQPESGKFLLHKFEQQIGQETYNVDRTGDGLTLTADFSFTDRGTTVPLKAQLRAAPDYTVQAFSTKGRTSRISQADVEVKIAGGQAQVRDGANSSSAAVPTKFFCIAGYAPVSMQMALLRYWRTHGSPATLATLPSGEVRISDRGPENFNVNGRNVKLERYSIRGLVWGLETIWADDQNNLAALVTRDAEFDHFEAVREQYEPALSAFVTSAARDGMAELNELGRTLPGRRSGTLAFTGATLIDGLGAPPVTNATIVISNGKIVAAGPANTVKVPKNAAVVDASGKYIIPGLWDMHAHYEQVEWGPIYLAAGVTTVRDVGNEFEFISAVRDQLNSSGLGPHMFLAGVVDGNGPMALGVERVNSAADAERWVKTYHDGHFQQMKIYSSVTSQNVKAICDAAHAAGMTVTGHIPIGMNIYDGVNDGMDQVNHLDYVMQPLMPANFSPRTQKPEQTLEMINAIDLHSPEAQKLVAFLKQHGTVIDDTVALFEMFGPRASGDPYSKVEPGVEHLAPELRRQYEQPPGEAARVAISSAMIKKDVELLGVLHAAGIPIVAGTDQAVPGYSVYREVELYVQAGFTPMEALQAATLVPARVMKVEADTGTVQPGKRADFDILDRNPLDDIHNIRSVHWVVANGVLYDPAPLWKSAGFQP